VLFGNRDPHCAQRNQETVADFRLVPIVDGNRGRVSTRFVLSGKTSRLNACAFIRPRRRRIKVCGNPF
jgi:hypothetical protein